MSRVCVGDCATQAPAWFTALAGNDLPFCCGNAACIPALERLRIGPYLLEVEPVSWSRPRPRRQGGWYTPGADEYRTAIAEALMVNRVRRRGDPGPFHLDVTFTLSNRRRHDADNLLKAFLDALVDLDVITDDNVEVVPSATVRTRLDARGSIVFTLTALRF